MPGGGGAAGQQGGAGRGSLTWSERSGCPSGCPSCRRRCGRAHSAAARERATGLAAARRDSPDTRTPPRPLGTEGEQGSGRDAPGTRRCHGLRAATACAAMTPTPRAATSDRASLPPDARWPIAAPSSRLGAGDWPRSDHVLSPAGCCRKCPLPPWRPRLPGAARRPLPVSRRGRDGPAPPPLSLRAAPAMAEPRLAVRRKSRSSSERKRSRAPVQPIAASSPVARKRPSSGGEGPAAEAPVGDGGILGLVARRGSPSGRVACVGKGRALYERL